MKHEIEQLKCKTLLLRLIWIFNNAQIFFRLAYPLLVLLAVLGTASSASSSPVFLSSLPKARLEHWQKREAEINNHVSYAKDLSAVKLLFVGDSITDFWLLDDNPWTSGQKYGRKIWDESFSQPG